MLSTSALLTSVSVRQKELECSYRLLPRSGDPEGVDISGVAEVAEFEEPKDVVVMTEDMEEEGVARVLARVLDSLATRSDPSLFSISVFFRPME